jgi:hypothetical protein
MDQNVNKCHYVTDYLANYSRYLTALNKSGLTDAAVLFEMFAMKVCSLWYNQPFHNLNTTKANFSYVDLVSEDDSIFVQVSTVQNIPSKIKSTLQKIEQEMKRNPNSHFAHVEKIKFFVTGNESVGRVRDEVVTGNNRTICSECACS